MSFSTSIKDLSINGGRGEKITNKSQMQKCQNGDDNANRLSSISDHEEKGQIEDSGYTTSTIPPLVSQSGSHDKLVIWDSEQQCTESGLREFEVVECQQIQTFLGNVNQGEDNEEEDDGGSLRDGKDEGAMSISSSSTASSSSTGVKRNDNDSNNVQSRIKRDREVRGKNACHSTEELDTCLAVIEKNSKTSRGGDSDRGKGGLKESKSETNVFVSSLSAISLSGSLSSALDTSGDARIRLPNSKTNPFHYANNATSALTRRGAAVDVSQDSPQVHPQEKHEHPQHCRLEHRQEEGTNHKNGLSSDVGLGQRRKAGFEERVLPPRRQQLVRPLCQTEAGRTQSLQEPSALQAEKGQHSNGPSRRFTKSSLPEPSDFSHLYSTVGVSQSIKPNQAAQREAQPVAKTPATTAQCTSSPPKPSVVEKRPQSQLTYRKNCSSPNRTGIDSKTSTPPHSPLRTPQGSPRRQPSMYFISRDARGVVRQIPPGCNPPVLTTTQGYGNTCLRAPVKTNISTTGIPKAPLNNQQSSQNSNYNPSPRESSPSPKLKPKGVRPKIITYVRKNPQFKPQAADGSYHVSSLPTRLSAYSHNVTPSSFKDTPKDPSKTGKDTRGVPVLSASNLLYEKYCHEMQTKSFPSGLLGRSIRAPGHTNTVPPAHTVAAQHQHTHSHTVPPKLGSKANDYYGSPAEVGSSHFKESSTEDSLQLQTAAQAGGSGSLLRSSRGMRLGLGAVTRTTTSSVKGRGSGQGQRAALVLSQPIKPVGPATNQKCQDNKAQEEVFTHQAPPPAPATAQPQAVSSRSLLPKASQSGLRPPGFSSSRIPAGRLVAFGFVRSSSVSSVSSTHSADSSQSDPCRTSHRLSVSDEPPQHRVTIGPLSTDHQRAVPCRSNSLQPPSTPALPRRHLPAQPRSSPGVGKKDFQRTSEVTRSLPSSPKRLAVVPPKPQSPVQWPIVGSSRGSGPQGSPCTGPQLKLQQETQESLQREKEEAQQKDRAREAEEREKEEQRAEVERLQGRCEQQERQLRALKAELRKTSLGLEAFIITTQHYCLKNKVAKENEQKLLLEMQNIRDEMVSNSMRWERLKLEKSALEEAFERELQELQLQQEAELAAVEEGLRKCHSAEAEHLKAEHQSEMEELRTQQQEQVEEMMVHHQAAIQELRDMHNITMATLHEEHARTMRDLRKAHEQQKTLMEEDFEKLRLSLQDQVDTLTFQNHSLRDKAKRFEEALRRSTDEQIVDALAPYQHIEQDLKSLKEIVEMKNQQIHQQEMKISDLEKVAQKNVFLEEKVQVLKQQNEDLKARIEMNLVLSRQLSEENANLQESVEKESTEKKRLSRNNEELLWRLQTSPLMSPSSSPLHRSFSTSPIPTSPFLSSSPVAGCDSPTHCHGCPQQAQYASPSHRANQNLSPGPATPTHRASNNQNFSPGPATPTHRASRCNSAACLSSLQR